MAYLRSGSRHTRQKYYTFYQAADKDGDGYLTKEELRVILQNCGFSTSEYNLTLMFKQTDIDNSGYISLDEYWLAMGQASGKEHVSRMLTKLCQVEDKSRTDIISWKSFSKVLTLLRFSVTTLEMSRVEEVSRQLTPNENVNYREFIKQIKKLWNELEELENFWKRADADGDGLLTLDELMVVLRQEGYTDEQIKRYFKEMDEDNDGSVTYREYMDSMNRVSIHTHKSASIRKRFMEFDKNHDGKLTEQELLGAVESMEDYRYYAFQQIVVMTRTERDDSGEIVYEEVVAEVEEIFAMQDTYKKFFQDADVNHSGKLTVSELAKALKQGGYKGTDSDIRRMLFGADVDFARKLDFKEYMAAMGRLPPSKHKEALLRHTFEEYDRDHDGDISEKELIAAFKGLDAVFPEKEITKMIKQAKYDTSGKLNYEQFLPLAMGRVE